MKFVLSLFTISTVISSIEGFSATPTGGLEAFKPELQTTAEKLIRPGYGLLACDESTGTVGSRLESIGMENTHENRATWRNLLFTAPNLNKYVSGCILYEETLFQEEPKEGVAFVDKLKDIGVVPGIKVDMGLKALTGGGPKETWCSGLDGLYERSVDYYKQGARFAKWRTAVRVDTVNNLPSTLAVEEAAHGLARYARITQEAGLVPIIEPEVLIDGTHTIEETAKVQENLISLVYKKCEENGVFLEGTLLKASMTVSGVDCPNKAKPEEIAKMTVQTLQRCVPVSVPGVVFLSGGISEEDASIYLNEINKKERKGPWTLTFSFSRAMQSSCLKYWGGKAENTEKAQTQLVARAQANACRSS